ncbi:MAG: methyl-accepting chemotaxis protein [Eubacteriales bacterium]
MRSIRVKILVGGLAVILFIGLAIGITVSVINYRAAISDMETIITTSATTYAKSVGNEIKLLKNELEDVANAVGASNGALSESKLRELFEEASASTDYKYFELYDEQGKSSSGKNIGNTDYFQIAKSGVTYMTGPKFSEDGQSFEILVAAKLPDSSRHDGVLVGVMDLNVLTRIVSSFNLSGSGYGYFIDKDGSIVVHPDYEVVSEYVTDPTAAKQSAAGIAISGFVEDAKQGKSGSHTYIYNGEKRYVAYRPTENTDGWSLAVIALYNDMLSEFYSQMRAIIIICAVMLLLGAVFCVGIATSISRPIVDVTERLRLLAAGDLHTPVRVIKKRDETGVLSTALKTTIDQLNLYINDIGLTLGSIADKNLRIQSRSDYQGDFRPIRESLDKIISSLNGALLQVRNSAQKVTAGSMQVDSNAQTLSQATTEQAATVEELAATVATISEQIRISEESAKTADVLSSEAADDVIKGNEYMQQLLSAMNDITESSQQISKINKVIEDIAFQTNILALNAAVEAARAGEAGKGFAVVADEVRNLAQKCAEAAQSTNALIASSLETVQKGAELTDETASALTTIVEKVRYVEKLIDDIALAASEQTVAVESINEGMSQIAYVTQNNSASAQEGAASSEELRDQAEVLNSIVEGFVLIEEELSHSED